MKKIMPLFISVIFVFIVIVIGNVVIVAQNRADMTIDSATQKRVIKQLANDLDENYVFPELAKQMGTDLNN